MTSHAIYQVKASALNLRAAPAMNAAIVAVMPNGAFVSAIEAPNAEGWLRVAWNAFTGFTSGKYLAPVSSGMALPTPLESGPPPADLLARDRAMDKLHPVVRDRVAKMVAQLNQDGAPFRAFETFRTPERQADLFAQGRAKAGSIVTRANAWQSYHQYGLAADLVLFIDNSWDWSDAGQKRAWWDRMTLVAPMMGLETLRFERPHVQLAGVRIDQLRQGIYPAGGDDTWFDALSESIRRWRASGHKLEAPPLLQAERPPLSDT